MKQTKLTTQSGLQSNRLVTWLLLKLLVPVVMLIYMACGAGQVLAQTWRLDPIAAYTAFGSNSRVYQVQPVGNQLHVAAGFDGYRLLDASSFQNIRLLGNIRPMMDVRCLQVSSNSSTVLLGGGNLEIEVFPSEHPLQEISIVIPSLPYVTKKTFERYPISIVTDLVTIGDDIFTSGGRYDLMNGGRETQPRGLFGQLAWFQPEYSFIDEARIFRSDSMNVGKATQLIGENVIAHLSTLGLEMLRLNYADKSFTRIGLCPVSGASCLAVQGNVAAIGVGNRLLMINLANQGNPIPYNQFTLPRGINAIKFIDQSTVLTAGPNGITLLDANDGTILLDHYTGGEGLGLAVSGEMVYLADGLAGIKVFKLSLPAPEITLIVNVDSHSAPANASLSVSSSNSTLSNVSFYNGQTLLGVLSHSPLSCEVGLSTAGTYTFSAVSQFNGVNFTSAPVNVVITNSQPSSSVLSSTLKGSHYAPGGMAILLVSISHESLLSVGLDMTLPPGFTYVSDTSGADVRPAAETGGTLSWAWVFNVPTNLSFSVTVKASASTTGEQTISGHALGRVNSGAEVRGPNNTAILVTRRYHSMDTNNDGKVSLGELLRLIALFTTKDSSGNRSGDYALDPLGNSEDGYVMGVGLRTAGGEHDADFGHDWRIGLSELLKAITLFTYTSNGMRTGEYTVDGTTEDGFRPGSASGVGLSSPQKAGLATVEGAAISTSKTTYPDAGGQVTISLSGSYNGTAQAIGWDIILPEGVSYISDSSTAQVKPSAGVSGNLEFAWFSSLPMSGDIFTVTLQISPDSKGSKTIKAKMLVREPLRILSAEVTLTPESTPSNPLPPTVQAIDMVPRITLTAEAGLIRVEASEQLVSPEWVKIAEINHSGGVLSVLDDGASGKKVRFYRVVLVK